MFPATPEEAQPSATPLDSRGGKSTRHPGYAMNKSVDGKPSYYAEIGHDGKVVFVANQ